MSKISEKFEGTRYEIVAWANDQRSLYYHEFGSYQGEWVLISKNGEYYIYKGSYGSCSGCDHYEAEMSYDSDTITKAKAKEFSKDYLPFLKVPVTTMVKLVERGTLQQIFPANFRDSYSDISLEEVVENCADIVRVEESLPLEVQDVIRCKNAELKQKMLKRFGYERFVSEAQMETLDEVGENKLLRHKDIVFAYVKDSSTGRRYLLRVPPRTSDVKTAIAWTFGLGVHEYNPLVET